MDRAAISGESEETAACLMRALIPRWRSLPGSPRAEFPYTATHADRLRNEARL